MESSKLEAVVGNHCIIGYVVRIIVRGIFHIIRVVVDPISIVFRRHIKFCVFGRRIPPIYETLNNRQVDHQESIIEMECKHCDQVVSILIDPRFNYSYVNPNLGG